MSINELNLCRFDLTLVNATRHNTLKVLPSSKNKQQKVVIGDDSGVVICFQIGKKGEYQEVFKHQEYNRPVTSISWGEQGDKIFIAYGQTIEVLKKKGKFLNKFSTSLNDDVQHMYVIGGEKEVWVAGKMVLAMYENFQDSNLFFMTPDEINDMNFGSVFSIHNTILSCKDGTIRILEGDKCVYEASVKNGFPTKCIMFKDGARYPFYNKNSNDYESDFISEFSENKKELFDFEAPKNYKHVLYGTDEGVIGQLCFNPKDTNHEAGLGNVVRHGFVIENDGPNKKAKINCMLLHDITMDGMSELLVGRNDGNFEIYSLNSNPPSPNPRLLFERSLGESITSIDVGHVLSLQSTDIIISTFSGKICSYTSSKIAMESGGKEEVLTGNLDEQRIKVVKYEIEKLKEKLELDKERYRSLSQKPDATSHQRMLSSFKLLPEEGAYKIEVEIQNPIDTVGLQSDTPILLLETPENKAIMSRSPSDEKNGNLVLATFRNLSDDHRMVIKIRTVEGQHGNIKLYVISKGELKFCQTVSFDIKPLSLHKKVSSSYAEEWSKKLNLNTLSVKGDVKLGEIHSWVTKCLPDVDIPIQKQRVIFCFKSTFVGSVLICDYQNGHGEFKSDSFTSLAILKEVVGKAATVSKTQILISNDLNEKCIRDILTLLKPKLDYFFSLSEKIKLLPPLEELQTHEEDISFLPEEYLEYLRNADAIKADFKKSPRNLDFLRGVVHDLYVDYHKLKGDSGKQKVQILFEVLKNYNFEELVDVFEGKN